MKSYLMWKCSCENDFSPAACWSSTLTGCHYGLNFRGITNNLYTCFNCGTGWMIQNYEVSIVCWNLIVVWGCMLRGGFWPKALRFEWRFTMYCFTCEPYNVSFYPLLSFVTKSHVEELCSDITEFLIFTDMRLFTGNSCLVITFTESNDKLLLF